MVESKFLVLHERSYLEAQLSQRGMSFYELKATDREVDPRNLIHFGSKLIRGRHAERTYYEQALDYARRKQIMFILNRL